MTGPSEVTMPDLKSCTSKGVQCQSLKKKASGLLGVLQWNAKFVYVIIILIRCRVRTSCHSLHPSYGVTAQSFEVLLFEECKSHGVRASCTASVQESLYLRHSQQNPQRCHPSHLCLSVIHPHKTWARTTGNTNRVLEWFYLSKQFRDWIKLQTTWQVQQSRAEPQYSSMPWNH